MRSTYSNLDTKNTAGHVSHVECADKLLLPAAKARDSSDPGALQANGVLVTMVGRYSSWLGTGTTKSSSFADAQPFVYHQMMSMKANCDDSAVLNASSLSAFNTFPNGQRQLGAVYRTLAWNPAVRPTGEEFYILHHLFTRGTPFCGHDHCMYWHTGVYMTTVGTLKLMHV
ncbi:hypothetical protein BKA80DRAFT_71633 [Phyllosticta citrichinensis]